MTQYAYPTSDIENTGAWTTEPLYAKVDEASYSDSDYIEAPDSTTANACVLGLGTLNDPGVGTGHTLRYRARRPSAQAVFCAVSIYYDYDGVDQALIHRGTAHDLTTSWAEYSYTIDSAEADLIADYSKLSVYLTSRGDGVASHCEVSWIRFECPSAAQTYNESVSDGVDFGDAVSSLATFPRGVSDGVTLGDSAAGGMSFDREASDGVVFSDAAVLGMSFFREAADGLVLSDGALSQHVACAVCADGMTLGDTLASTLFANAEASDGVIFADAATANLLMSMAVGDTVVFSDSPQGNLIMTLGLADAVVFGDRILIPATGMLRAVLYGKGPTVLFSGSKPAAVLYGTGPRATFKVLT